MGARPGLALGLLALTQIGERGVVVAAHDNRDVAGALQDLRGASTCTRAPALQRRALVGVARRHEELFGRNVVVVLGVGHCGIQALADHLGHRSLGEGKDLGRTTVGLAPHEVQHGTGLARRHTDVFHDRTRPRTLVGLQAGHQRRPPFSWPAWCRKVRVGANSPSLWPTIDSVMYTGTCLRPSCTPIV